jgi:hypothetical protein
MAITMQAALTAYRAGNNAGRGFAPDGGETVDEAVQAYASGGGRVLLERRASDEVAVIESSDGDLIAIGGDAMGRGAWAVALTDEASDDVFLKT